ncbi:glycosyltransferase family 2 protein [uncultured Christiangramia sp.]|uniref:glycosyltransferase family 2 protein n=1 Tax=uncultured Christiangramia sp. TaxID=503836 RepID=UPI002610585E|nr:glycosyltransferase family 2 protein [uncultured Christiangramia sp.]
MLNKPLVSIVMPTYNREDSLKFAIQSVLKQSYNVWELIIVDDCSTDNTGQVVRELQKEDERIIFHRLHSNSGACAARNKGIELAKGEFITFLDSDDEYYPEKVEKQIEIFKKSDDKNLGVVSCGAVDFRDNVEYNRRMPVFKKNYYFALLSKESKIGAGTPFLMVRSNVLKAEGILFDPKMPAMQDWDFLLRICKNFNFQFVPEYLVKVNHHSNARVYNSSNVLSALDEQYSKYKTWLTQEPEAHKSFVKDASVIKAHHHSIKNAIDFLNSALKDFSGKKDKIEIRLFKTMIYIFRLKYIKLFYMKYLK